MAIGLQGPQEFTWGGHNFWIGSDGSPEYGWSIDNSRLTVTYFTYWLSRHQAAAALLGTCSVVNQGGKGFVSRLVPHTPDWDAFAFGWLYAKSIQPAQGRWSRAGILGLGPQFDMAKFTVTYEALPYDVLTDAELLLTPAPSDESNLSRFVEFQGPKASTRWLMTRGGGFEWVARTPHFGFPLGIPRPIMEGVPVAIQEAELIYVWHQVPWANAPRAFIANSIGKTNSVTFDIYEPGTVVLMSGDPTRTRMPDSVRAVNMTYKLKFYPNGCSFLPDPTAGNAMREAKRSGSVDGIYLATDLRNLFVPTL